MNRLHTVTCLRAISSDWDDTKSRRLYYYERVIQCDQLSARQSRQPHILFPVNFSHASAAANYSVQSRIGKCGNRLAWHSVLGMDRTSVSMMIAVKSWSNKCTDYKSGGTYSRLLTASVNPVREAPNLETIQEVRAPSSLGSCFLTYNSSQVPRENLPTVQSSG